MPIYYSKDEGGWSLKNVTAEEIEQLTEVGKQYALQMLGAAIVKKYQEYLMANEGKTLDDIPKELMGQG
jgi:hypothetical protein